MKQVLKSVIIIILLMAFFLVGGCSSEATTEENISKGKETVEEKIEDQVEEIRLRASSGLTELHFFNRGFVRPLFERLEEETDGALSFEVFTAGELIPLGTEFDALRHGTIDISLTLTAIYDPQRFPYTEVVMLPLHESDAHIIATAMQNLMKSDREIIDGKTYYQVEFGDKDLVVFTLPPTEPYLISTTGHRFESLEQFSEVIRMRTASRVHEILSSNLNLSSLSMPITDAYDALSRNALDGIFYNVPDWEATGLDDLINYTIEGVNLGHFVNQIAMTQATWDKLPGKIQEKFEQAANELIFDGALLTMGEAESGKENNIEKGGEFVHLHDLDPATRDHINQAMVKTWYDWIENLESQQLAGREMAILWRDMLVEAGAVLPKEIMEIE
ncbi:hypothetical protein [Alkalihalobacterium alkalinitrilicum]|uniref:hypothetical protein n=1 Tax=Alkalihalobacterium alkalinitrilicum TaxID=427920 RepID=UPI0009957649|nr:hypothetical protein [Alkalihalobacterium alkalinitrilicum]